MLLVPPVLSYRCLGREEEEEGRKGRKGGGKTPNAGGLWSHLCERVKTSGRMSDHLQAAKQHEETSNQLLQLKRVMFRGF